MPENKHFIDYSQFREWQKCEWAWTERYLNWTQREPRQGLKNNALTLGSLVHKGLENFRAGAFPYLQESDMTKLDASPECMAQAQLLLAGYIEHYPNEEFLTYHLEEPVRFPLTTEVDGLAKIDSYFQVDVPTTLEDGLGDSFTLDPGIWIKEYKTKDPFKNIGNYMLGWKVNMQACFQILALQAKLCQPIRGVLVDVLEKPGEYVPRHTCKGCKVQSERRDWLPTGEGYSCPKCGNAQPLDIKDKSKKIRQANYYRIMVTRSEQELEKAREELEGVAVQMHEIRGGFYPPARATERCVDSIFGPCLYFPAHSNLQPAKGYEGFVQIDPFSYIEEKI